MSDDARMGPEDRRAYIDANYDSLFRTLVSFISPHTHPEREVAEDLVQEAMTQSVKPTSGLNERGKIVPWMQTIVWRAYADWCEKRRRERDFFEADTPYVVRDGKAGPEESPEEYEEGIRHHLRLLRDRPDIQPRYKPIIEAILAVGFRNEDIARKCSEEDPGHDRNWARSTKAQLVRWMTKTGLNPRDYGFAVRPTESTGTNQDELHQCRADSGDASVLDILAKGVRYERSNRQEMKLEPLPYTVLMTDSPTGRGPLYAYAAARLETLIDVAIRERSLPITELVRGSIILLHYPMKFVGDNPEARSHHTPVLNVLIRSYRRARSIPCGKRLPQILKAAIADMVNYVDDPDGSLAVEVQALIADGRRTAKPK